MSGLSFSSAEAAPVGQLAWTPGSGSDDTPLEVVTTGGCPPPATNVVGVLFGKGFPTAGQNVVGNTDAGVSQSGPFRIVIADTLRQFARMQPKPFELSGEYRLVVTCREPLEPKSLGDFVGTITFTSPTAFVAKQPASMPAPAAESVGVPVPFPSGRGLAPGQPGAAGAASGGIAGGSAAGTPAAAAGAQLADAAVRRSGSGPGLLGAAFLAVAAFGGGIATITALQRRKALR